MIQKPCGAMEQRFKKFLVIEMSFVKLNEQDRILAFRMTRFDSDF